MFVDSLSTSVERGSAFVDGRSGRMSVTVLHSEDVKAELRKRHGTIRKFAAARELKPQQVADWLRGRASAPVAKAIAAELGVDDEEGSSIKLDDSAGDAGAHRLIGEAR